MADKIVLDNKEQNIIINTIADRVKEYTGSMSRHILRTVVQHMLIKGLNEINEEREKDVSTVQ